MPDLQRLMEQRPHPACSVSAQQLGDTTARVHPQQTSFIHRDAVWKPWITALWPAGDRDRRQRSLTWLDQVWKLLQPVCPGHLSSCTTICSISMNWILPLASGCRSCVAEARDPRGMLPPL